MSKIALISGINGQDGSYLAELLLEKKYKVHGIVRRDANLNKFWRLKKIIKKIKLHKANFDNLKNLKKTN